MKALRVKRGDTFAVSGVRYTAGGTPVNLTGYTVRSQVRDPSTDELVATLDVVVTDAVNGAFAIGADPADTASWPLGRMATDIEFESAGGIVDSTETATLEVIQDVTR